MGKGKRWQGTYGVQCVEVGAEEDEEGFSKNGHGGENEWKRGSWSACGGSYDEL